MDYDFRHLELRMASLSEEMYALAMAGDEIGFDVNPIEELLRLDCVPTEMTIAATVVDDGATAVEEIATDFENTRRQLLRKWRGDAADEFARTSNDLLGSYLANRSRLSKNGAAGQQIATDLDELAKGAATDGRAIAVQAFPASKLVLSGAGDVEGAAQAVREAIVAIQQLVNRGVAEIPSIGAALDNTRG